MVVNVSISDAKAQLTELVRRAEAGEEVVVTRHGRPAVRLVPASAVPLPRFDRKVIDEITRRAVQEALPGPGAAHASDFLYDEDGLPH
jgi:prevent-host-death family protein